MGGRDKYEIYKGLGRLCGEHGTAEVIQALADAVAAAGDASAEPGNYKDLAVHLLGIGQSVVELEARIGAPTLEQALDVLAEMEGA